MADRMRRPISVRALLAVWAALACLPSRPSVAAEATAASPTLARIASDKVIRIGHREGERPFSYLVDGQPVGYSMDLCAEVVDGLRRRLGLDRLRVEYVHVTTATRFVLVRGGKVDIECAATTNTPERRKLAEFSIPLFLSATRFVARKDSGIAKLADLAGHSVVSITGTVNIDQLNAINRARELDISVILSRSDAEAFALVESGKAAAFVTDDILLAGLVAAARDPSALAISAEAISEPAPYGLLLPPGDLGFKDEVDRILSELYADGRVRAIYRKWFQAPTPPDGANLQLPLSPELERIFTNPGEYGS